MTSVGRVGGDGGIPPVFTGPVFTGVPGGPRVEGPVPPVDPVRPGAGGTAEAIPVPQPTITLAGRLATGDALPAPAALAIALEQATRALQGGRAHEVLAALDGAWSSKLAHDSPWYLRAAALELLARHDDAAGLLREAIAQLPASAALLYLLGVHAAIAGDDAAAQLATQHALQVHPEEPVLLVLRAAILARGGQPFEANALLTRAVALAPGLPVREWFEVLARLGRAVPRPADTTSGPGPVRTARATPSGALRAVPPTTDRGAGATGDATATRAPSARADDAPADALPADGGGAGLVPVRRTPLSTATVRADDARRPDEAEAERSWASPLRPGASEPPVPEGLADALRYGLALLDAPADAARAATRHRGVDDTLASFVSRAGLTLAPPGQAGGPGLVAVAACALVVTAVVNPAVRGTIVVVLAAGAAWWVLRRTRRAATAPDAREALASPARTVDRRIE